jgi:phospholipase C
MNSYALTALDSASDITGGLATSNHSSINQRWVLHAQPAVPPQRV